MNPIINDMWNVIKIIYRFFSGLWVDNGGEKISIGRLLLVWIILDLHRFYFSKSIEVPTGVVFIVTFLLAYNFAKKLDIIGDFFLKVRGKDPIQENKETI